MLAMIDGPLSSDACEMIEDFYSSVHGQAMDNGIIRSKYGIYKGALAGELVFYSNKGFDAISAVGFVAPGVAFVNRDWFEAQVAAATPAEDPAAYALFALAAQSAAAAQGMDPAGFASAAAADIGEEGNFKKVGSGGVEAALDKIEAISREQAEQMLKDHGFLAPKAISDLLGPSAMAERQARFEAELAQCEALEAQGRRFVGAGFMALREAHLIGAGCKKPQGAGNGRALKI